MIIYATKQTFERYNLKLPQKLTPPLDALAIAVIEKEGGNRLFEWGAKLFYFDGRKCIQVVNFASKFTLVLADIKVGDLQDIGGLMAHYLFELYKNDKEMTQALEKMFEDSPITCFTKLTDKSAIATLNYTQRCFLDEGDMLYDFLKDGVLHTMDINKILNSDWLFTMTANGKTDYFYSGEKFRELVLEKYK